MATKIRDIIDYYSGHNVPDEIKERVLDRISNTQDDKEANEAFRELWNKADSAYMEEEEISAAYNRLFETEETREIEKKKSLRIFNFAKLAAVFVPLLMLIVFGKLYVQMNNQLKDIKLATMLQEHTINEESKVIALADGTKVRLSQSSVLLYPSSFKGAEERKVFLSGEAFFDIRHDDAQPFHVSTPHFEITDLGTSFTVSSYSNTDEVSATLKTGKIELRIIGQEDKVYSMKPNDQLVYNVKTKAVNLRKVRPKKMVQAGATRRLT
ncbi:anti-sigma factor [Segatella copri]|uniref:Anti-sigma factor n=1 Tax=Segatella copri TaxID=165179 RepID=A0AA92TJK0_9BACT|nr:anti-sigma factor [Segatella copri]